MFEKNNAEKSLQILKHFGKPNGYKYPNDDALAKAFVMLTTLRYSGYFSKSGPSMAKYLAEYVKLYSKDYGKKLPACLAGLVKYLILLNGEMEFNDTVSPITELKMPVLLISGKEDMVCPTPTAKRWFDNLTAPKKEFIEVKNASHMVNFEKSDEWNEAVKGLLK